MLDSCESSLCEPVTWNQWERVEVAKKKKPPKVANKRKKIYKEGTIKYVFMSLCSNNYVKLSCACLCEEKAILLLWRVKIKPSTGRGHRPGWFYWELLVQASRWDSSSTLESRADNSVHCLDKEWIQWPNLWVTCDFVWWSWAWKNISSSVHVHSQRKASRGHPGLHFLRWFKLTDRKSVV